MINGTPQIVRRPIDPHEHFVQAPAPVRVPTKMNPTLPDLRCKQRTEPVTLTTIATSADATSSSSTASPRWPSGVNWQPDAIRFAHFAVWFALV